nr:uncharacterized protein LOC109426945 [Aedes albopictus]
MHEDNIANEHNSVLMTSMSNLSFASLQVPECKPCDEEEDIDRKTYEQWKELLEASMQLAGVSDEFTKMNIFKIKAGPKLLDVLEGTVSNLNSPDIRTAPYSNAIQRLCTFFGSRDYSFMQRQKLRTLTQKAGETDSKYVKRVIAIAKLCDFDEKNLVEQVADSIQAHASDRKVREAARKFLRKGGQLSELLDKVRTLEMDQMNEAMYAKSHQQAKQQAEVAAVTTTRSTNVNRMDNRKFQRNDQQRNGGNWRGARGRGFLRREFIRGAASQDARCWRCLSVRHAASDCWSIQQTCHNCKRKGHVARACRHESSSGPIKRRISSDEKETASSSKKVAIVKQDEDGAVNNDVSSPSST